MKLRLRLALLFRFVLLLSPSLAPCTVAAQPKEENVIVFLHLRMKDGQVTLVKSSTAPGVLKTPSEQPARAIQFTIENAAGAAVWTSTMDDPAVRRLEYTDPDAPGVIKSRIVQLDDVEFTIRVPQRKDGVKLAFYRGAGSPFAKQGAAEKKLIGTITLSPAATK